MLFPTTFIKIIKLLLELVSIYIESFNFWLKILHLASKIQFQTFDDFIGQRN